MDHGEVLAVLLQGDLIDVNRHHVIQVDISQAPLNRTLHEPKDCFPTRVESVNGQPR